LGIEFQPPARGNLQGQQQKSEICAFIEHVFAREKGPMGFVIRITALARARVKSRLANLTYNMKRPIWLATRTASA